MKAGEAERVLFLSEAIDLTANPEVAHLRALAILRLGRREEAASILEALLREHPSQLEWATDLGILLLDLNRPVEAEARLRLAISSAVPTPRAQHALAETLLKLGRLQEAEEIAASLLQSSPENVRAHDLMVRALTGTERARLACAHAKQYANARPALYRAQLQWSLKSGEAAAWDDTPTALRATARLDPVSPDSHSALLYRMLFVPEFSSDEIVNEHRRYAGLWAVPPMPPAPRRSAGPIRIAVATGDFRIGSATAFMGPLLSGFDRNEVQLVLYSTGEERLPTDRLAHFFDEMHDVGDRADEAIASQIREDDVDVLIDIAGHHHDNRLPLFTHRPARLQLAYPRYPFSTGLTCFDGLVTDSWTSPPGTDREYVEPLLRLPSGYLAFAPREEVEQPARRPASSGHVRFGLFQQAVKLHSVFIDTLSAILRRMPDSSLLIHHGYGKDIQELLRQEFAARSVTEHQLEFAGEADYGKHMGLIGSVDIALDTWPYNGQTTTCECLYMGVPVVTVQGDRHAARVSAGMLRRLGRPAWIAADPSQYVEIAVQLASSVETLTACRESLRDDMRACGLVDGRRVAESLLQEIRRLVRR